MEIRLLVFTPLAAQCAWQRCFGRCRRRIRAKGGRWRQRQTSAFRERFSPLLGQKRSGSAREAAESARSPSTEARMCRPLLHAVDSKPRRGSRSSACMRIAGVIEARACLHALRSARILPRLGRQKAGQGASKCVAPVAQALERIQVNGAPAEAPLTANSPKCLRPPLLL